MEKKVFMGSKEFKGLEEMVEYVLSEDLEDVDVVIIPPDPDVLTDNEDIDDDNIFGDLLPNDIPGSIEIFLEDTRKNKENLPHKRAKKIESISQGPIWVKQPPKYTSFESFGNGSQIRSEAVKKELKDLNPKNLFEKFFDDKTVSYIVEQTELYANQNNAHNFKTSIDEIRNFFGILFFSGYHKLPRERLYWSNDDDLGIDIVTSCMSRNRFEELKKFFHLADNSNARTTSDKLFKIRPVMEILNEKFCQFGIFSEKLSVDESMVKYYGRHPSKQFIQGKPIRMGFKNWVLASSTGYCYKFDTYSGKSKDNTEKKDPLGSSVVKTLLTCVQHPKDHIVFFDNFFTNYDLLVYLKETQFRATGTMRQNRTKKCPLVEYKNMKKKLRGEYDYYFDKSNEILIAEWKDNNVVIVGTNYSDVEPMAKVKRWSNEAKKKIDIKQPNLISEYNSGMGGVDLHDQSINLYRIAIRGKKFWWILFTNMLDMAMTNAWKLHLLSADVKMDQLAFTRNVARYYLRLNTKSKSRRQSGTLPQGLAQDNFGHFPEKLINRLRCAVCSSRIRWRCKKCLKTLCIEKNCFEKFHTK